MTPEVRTISSKMELREEGGKKKLVGYFARFNEPSEEIWEPGVGVFTETIAEGAFAESIERKDRVISVLDHKHDILNLLGNTDAGSLVLREDKLGLWGETEIPDTEAGRTLVYHSERGNVTKASFAFFVDNPEEDERWQIQDGEKRRVVVRAKLRDVSAVIFPAYESTSIGLRSLQYVKAIEAAKKEEEDFRFRLELFLETEKLKNR